MIPTDIAFMRNNKIICGFVLTLTIFGGFGF